MDAYKRPATGRDSGRGQERRIAGGDGRGPGEQSGRADGDKGGVRSYRELRVYQAALEAAEAVFAATQTAAPESGASLDPMRQRALFLCVRLGEAWRRRRSAAQFVEKLTEAESDAEGMRVCVELAERCGFIPRQSAAELDDRYDKILGQLFRMISEPEPWTMRKEAR